MTMMRCRECGEAVSSEAVTCPHCGASDPAVPGDATTPRTERVHGSAAHPAADPRLRRSGVRRGWRTMTLLLLLVLIALFALWYGDVVDFN